MTSWCPILNLNGLPRDLDESNTFPFASVPVEAQTGEASSFSRVPPLPTEQPPNGIWQPGAG